MRVRVYVDGFNLYYRLLKHSRYKWTDLKLLSSELLQTGDVIERIRYFTADVSPRAGDPDAPTRQQAYFRALRTIPELEIHKGTFLAKTIHRPVRGQEESYVYVRDTEEKGSDVNLASHLLMDGFCDTYDIALVMSQDTDLLEPIRMVSQELGKVVIVAWFEDTSPSKLLRQYATSVRHIRPAMLRRSQFPNPVIGRGGAKLRRPDEWDPDREM
ncbi:NYN domain-containing protein [Roseobacter sp. CCS2]|uniref:NYN domain-containing protein n=1 Tax=Roseobacter sp. CCS2 TaxID=391593 RepID=UPI0000F4034E|nr:NYN domain-containing protein [Roseobacter sp. CCS2]EBA14182.1 hypothetical protein RCCS2_09834 [Roseobacter sp. CCS2]